MAESFNVELDARPRQSAVRLVDAASDERLRNFRDRQSMGVKPRGSLLIEDLDPLEPQFRHEIADHCLVSEISHGTSIRWRDPFRSRKATE